MNTLPSKTLVLTLLPLILAACGGGGGDAPVADNPPADTNTSRPSTSTPTTPQNPTDNRRTSPTNNTSRPAAPTNTAANRPLDADEQRAFAASKTSAYPPIWNGRDKVEPLRITAGNATLASFDGSISRSDFRSLPAGFATLSGDVSYLKTGRHYQTTVRSYQGFRSGVVTSHAPSQGFAYSDDYGINTLVSQIPQSGKATYSGIAFDRSERGTLTYDVDFFTRLGEGRINGLSRYGTISLHPVQLQSSADKAGFVGSASATGHAPMEYRAVLYGSNAEEIAGSVTNTTELEHIGFHGSRGDITP